jgi:hypothetical protein
MVEKVANINQLVLKKSIELVAKGGEVDLIHIHLIICFYVTKFVVLPTITCK